MREECVTEGMTLGELAAEIQNYLRTDAGIDFVAVNATASGEIVIDTSLSAEINGLQIPPPGGSNSFIANAFTFPPSLRPVPAIQSKVTGSGCGN